MILNNYWKYRQAVEKTYYKVGEGNFNIVTGALDTSGTVNEIIGGTAGVGWQFGLNFSLRANLTLMVGSSDQEPTPSDYNLLGNQTGSFSNYQVNVVTSSESGSYKTIITASGRNSSGSAITIKEIGVGKKIITVVPDTMPYTVLFVRHILDEPIVVENNGNFSLVFEWDEA